MKYIVILSFKLEHGDHKRLTCVVDMRIVVPPMPL